MTNKLERNVPRQRDSESFSTELTNGKSVIDNGGNRNIEEEEEKEKETALSGTDFNGGGQAQFTNDNQCDMLVCYSGASNQDRDENQLAANQYDRIGSLSQRGSSFTESTPVSNTWDMSISMQIPNIQDSLNSIYEDEILKGKNLMTQSSPSREAVIGSAGDPRTTIRSKDGGKSQHRTKTDNHQSIETPKEATSHDRNGGSAQLALGSHGEALHRGSNLLPPTQSGRNANERQITEGHLRERCLDANISMICEQLPSIHSTNNESHWTEPIFIMEPYGSIEGELAGSHYEANVIQHLAENLVTETDISGQISGFDKADLTLQYDQSGRQNIMLDVLCHSNRRHVDEDKTSNMLNFHIQSATVQEADQIHSQRHNNKQTVNLQCLTAQNSDLYVTSHGGYGHKGDMERFYNGKGGIVEPSACDNVLVGHYNGCVRNEHGATSNHNTTPSCGCAPNGSDDSSYKNIDEFNTTGFSLTHGTVKANIYEGGSNIGMTAECDFYDMGDGKYLNVPNVTPMAGNNHSNDQSIPNIQDSQYEQPSQEEDNDIHPETWTCMNTCLETEGVQYPPFEVYNGFGMNMRVPQYVEAVATNEDQDNTYMATPAYNQSTRHNLSDRHEYISKGSGGSSTVTKFASLVATPQRRLEQIDDVFFHGYDKSPLYYHSAAHGGEAPARDANSNLATMPMNCLTEDGRESEDGAYENMVHFAGDVTELKRAHGTTIRVHKIPHGRVLFYGLHGTNYQYVTTFKHPEFKHDSTCTVTTNELGFDSEESLNRSLNAKSEIIIRPPASLGGPIFFRGNVAKSMICRQDYIANSVFQINWQENKLKQKRKGAILKCCTVD